MRRAALVTAMVLAAVAGEGVSVAGSGKEGIRGRVTEAPTCPVESYPPQPGCAPRGITAALRVHGLSRGLPTEVLHTSHAGYFRAELPPGRYRLTPLARRGSPYPRPPAPILVRVRRASFTAVQIVYDSGIR